MRRVLAMTVLALTPSLAEAQVEGFRLEGGVAFLTKSGSLSFGTSAIESDAGVAVRGALRFGISSLSLAAEIQSSSQGYNQPVPGYPQSLNATYIGLSAAIHPFSVVRITPYIEGGIGRLFFADDKINEQSGVHAWTAGLGARIKLAERLDLDLGLRLLQQGDVALSGLPQTFKYDPKLFSILLSLKL
jgi:hypothetical protein